MKHIFIYIFAAFLMIAIADRSISLLFTELVFKKTLSGESGGTINYAIRHGKDIDFLILGASIAKHTINPDLLTSLEGEGYNLGINGVSILNNLLTLDILIQNGIAPKVIILQTVLPDYTKEANNNESLRNQIKRVYPYDTDLIRSYVRSLGVFEEVKYTSWLYRFNRKIINISFNYLKKDTIQQNNGFVPLPGTEYTIPPIYKEYIYDEKSVARDALQKIKELADKHNSKIIIVFPPSYKNTFTTKEQSDILIKDLKESGFKYIIDMSDITKLPQLENREYWRDANHLNATGAALFSQLLNKEIKKVLLLSK